MFILIGAVALLYMMAMGMYVILAVVYAAFLGVKNYWSDL